jgi:hypothetical protein
LLPESAISVSVASAQLSFSPPPQNVIGSALTLDAKVSFGHFSQVTMMTLIGSAEHPLLVSGDADERLRVGRFPATFDIQSMCLGHRKYASN